MCIWVVLGIRGVFFFGAQHNERCLDLCGGRTGLYETRGKMKHELYFLLKRTLNLFLLKNNMSVSLCPTQFCVSYSPIHPNGYKRVFLRLNEPKIEHLKQIGYLIRNFLQNICNFHRKFSKIQKI
jgi:hypothetical protein